MTQPLVHILVVDDERNIRNHLPAAARGRGLQGGCGGNGDEGLQRVKNGRYDIVFVDIQMPLRKKILDGSSLTA